MICHGLTTLASDRAIRVDGLIPRINYIDSSAGMYYIIFNLIHISEILT